MLNTKRRNEDPESRQAVSVPVRNSRVWFRVKNFVALMTGQSRK